MKNKMRKTAIMLAKTNGLMNLSRKELCDAVGIPDGSFVHVMGCTFTEFFENLSKEIGKEKLYIVKKRRANPRMRKRQLLEYAVKLANEHGVENITRNQIAEAAGVSVGLINLYYNTMTQLRRAVRRHIGD